jgi:hypothetical protein
LRALLDVSETVLMDFRSFSSQNSGCVYELQQLLRRVPTDNLVLVCDDTTDLPLLERILADACSAAQADGCARGSGEIALVRMTARARREFGVLKQRLLGRVEPQQMFPPA